MNRRLNLIYYLYRIQCSFLEIFSSSKNCKCDKDVRPLRSVHEEIRIIIESYIITTTLFFKKKISQHYDIMCYMHYIKPERLKLNRPTPWWSIKKKKKINAFWSSLKSHGRPIFQSKHGRSGTIPIQQNFHEILQAIDLLVMTLTHECVFCVFHVT